MEFFYPLLLGFKEQKKKQSTNEKLEAEKRKKYLEETICLVENFLKNVFR